MQLKCFQSILNSLTLEADYYFSFASFRNLVLIVGCTASYALFATLPLKLWIESDSGGTSYYPTGLLALALIAWAVCSLPSTSAFNLALVLVFLSASPGSCRFAIRHTTVKAAWDFSNSGTQNSAQSCQKQQLVCRKVLKRQSNLNCSIIRFCSIWAADFSVTLISGFLSKPLACMCQSPCEILYQFVLII